MSRTTRRVVLYGAGLALVAVGLWLKYGYTVAPDPGVRLNGAAVIASIGQYDEALEICEVVLKEHPDSIEARVYKATFLSAADRHEEALAAYDDVLERVTDAEMRRNLEHDRAGVLLSMGRLDAFKAARDKLASAGVDHRVHVLDGLAAGRRADHAASVAAYTRAHEAAPDDERIKGRLWRALMTRGEHALADRRFDEAREAFDAACPLFESATNAHLKAAEVRLATEDVEGAALILRKLGPATPGAAPLLFRVATRLIEDGDSESALDALAAALDNDFDTARILLEKEESWTEMRDDKRLRDLLEQYDEEKD